MYPLMRRGVLHLHLVCGGLPNPILCSLLGHWLLSDGRPISRNLTASTIPVMMVGYGWGCITFQKTASRIHHMHLNIRHLSTFCWWGCRYGCTLTLLKIYATNLSQDLGELTESRTCVNNVTTLWLRMYNLSKCIPHPSHTYLRCLGTFCWCG